MPSLVAFVPARAGSERIPGKNVRPLAGHPLLAYAVATARQSGVADRVICSTDSEEIAETARWYGAESLLRPAEYATAVSPDVDWLRHALEELPEAYELFALIRPTSPFRGPDTVRLALDKLLGSPDADSIRAVEPVKQHPGKMWLLDGDTMRPLLDQSHLEVPWHDSQFQALPPVYVQSSALEIAWTRVVAEGTLGGKTRLPLFLQGYEGLSIDREDDWARAEALLAAGEAALPRIDVEPWRS
jgi:CMP-N,N'-diacetyllegionaminic acid synthase